MLVTISKASKMAGVSRATIYNDIDSGTLSVELGAKNRKMVDVSELSRVYKNLKNPDDADNSKSVKSDKKREVASPQQSEKVAVLQERIEAQRKQTELLEAMLEREREDRRREREASKEFEDYFKAQIDNQAESIKNFTKLLEDQRGDKTDTNDDWKKSINALEERIANQETEAKEKAKTEAREKEEIQKELEEKEQLLKEKEEALELEKHKSFIHRMLGK
tara:strand:- start:32878 stop:33540 length:663 start_codon:yes stop_codon:yes gene_type:complete